jgi:hypothetical protein
MQNVKLHFNNTHVFTKITQRLVTDHSVDELLHKMFKKSSFMSLLFMDFVLFPPSSALLQQ